LDLRPLVDAVADLRAVEAAVAIRRDDEWPGREGRDVRGRRVDADQVRHHDRPPLAVEVDAWLVGPFVDDPAGTVPPVPGVGDEASALRAVAGELAHHVAARVDDLDADAIGLAEPEADLGRRRLAVAGRREDLRDGRADDRVPRQFEL